MAALGAVLAFFVFATGHKAAAVGILAGAPVGMLNYLLSYSGQKKAVRDTNLASIGLVLKLSLLRVVTAVVALLLALTQGVEFFLGVFCGILLELGTYYGDVVRHIFGL